VVAFGAFVEIIPGVEGLVHISELAEHHVESPSEVVSPGDQVWVRILEIDENRRRISLSVKRAESQNLPLRDLMPPELTGEPQAEATPDEVPDLDVSEEVFPEAPPPEDGEQSEASEPAGDAEAGEPADDAPAGEPTEDAQASEPPDAEGESPEASDS